MIKTLRLKKNFAVLVPVTGPIKELKGDVSLDDAQQLVGGYVEALVFERDGIKAQALFDEEGLLKSAVLNPRACVMTGRALVGPVIIVTGKRRWP